MAVVIYDSACGICRCCLALLLSADRTRALRPLPLGTPEADRLLADLDPAARAASWHLVDANGKRASAGAALAPALTLLPGGGGAAAILRRAPRLAERGYGAVAGNRARLGRLVPARARRWADRVIARHLPAGGRSAPGATAVAGGGAETRQRPLPPARPRS